MSSDDGQKREQGTRRTFASLEIEGRVDEEEGSMGTESSYEGGLRRLNKTE